MDSGNPGVLTAPIIAVRQDGPTTYSFSWIYIEAGSLGAGQNAAPINYSIEYKFQPNSDTDFDNTAGWNKVDFNDTAAGQTFLEPAGGTQAWLNRSLTVEFAGGNGNPVIPAGSFVFFRVNFGAGIDPDAFAKGIIYPIGLPASGPFYNDFTADVNDCYIK
jgi:hypothetical protein